MNMRRVLIVPPHGSDRAMSRHATNRRYKG